METVPTEGAEGSSSVGAGDTTTTADNSKKAEGWRKYVEEYHSGDSAAAVAFAMRQEGVSDSAKAKPVVVSDLISCTLAKRLPEG